MEIKKNNNIIAVQKQYHDGAVAFAEKVKAVYADYDFKSGRDIEEVYLGLPSEFRAMRALNTVVRNAIDDMPLTVAERNELTAVAKEAEREARKIMQSAYKEASATLEKKAKEFAIDQQYFYCAFRNLSSSAKEKIFDEAWAVAYERAHSEGFMAVIIAFGEVMDFAEKVVEATVAKGGEK